jgi:hypothetical protein
VDVTFEELRFPAAKPQVDGNERPRQQRRQKEKVVRFAPKARVVRTEREEMPAGAEHSRALTDERTKIWDVLQHVPESHCIECVACEWQFEAARTHDGPTDRVPSRACETPIRKARFERFHFDAHRVESAFACRQHERSVSGAHVEDLGSGLDATRREIEKLARGGESDRGVEVMLDVVIG